jgi:hypothetical protein
MSDFRRFVIGLSGFCSLVLIIAATIISGFVGAAAIGIISGRGENAALGFLLGAVSGFCCAALPAAMVFTFVEIAENTRKTLQLLEGAVVRDSQPGSSQTTQQPRIRIRPQ